MLTFTPRQRKKIIAELVAGATLSQLARKYNASQSTISRICSGDPKFAQKAAKEQESNEHDALGWIHGQSELVRKITDNILDTITPEEIKAAPLRDRIGALKILIELYAPKSDGIGNEQKRVIISIEDCSDGGSDTDGGSLQ